MYSRHDLPLMLRTPPKLVRHRNNRHHCNTHHCCKDGMPLQLVSASSEHPLGRLICTTCREPACSKCPASQQLLQKLGCGMIMTMEAEGMKGFTYGTICCQCGWSSEVDNDNVKQKRSFSFSSCWLLGGEKRLAGQPKTIDFRIEKCKFCNHACCENCIKFKLNDGVPAPYTTGLEGMASHPPHALTIAPVVPVVDATGRAIINISSLPDHATSITRKSSMRTMDRKPSLTRLGPRNATSSQYLQPRRRTSKHVHFADELLLNPRTTRPESTTLPSYTSSISHPNELFLPTSPGTQDTAFSYPIRTGSGTFAIRRPNANNTARSASSLQRMTKPLPTMKPLPNEKSLPKLEMPFIEWMHEMLVVSPADDMHHFNLEAKTLEPVSPLPTMPSANTALAQLAFISHDDDDDDDDDDRNAGNRDSGVGSCQGGTVSECCTSAAVTSLQPTTPMPARAGDYGHASAAGPTPSPTMLEEQEEEETSEYAHYPHTFSSAAAAATLALHAKIVQARSPELRRARHRSAAFATRMATASAEGRREGGVYASAETEEEEEEETDGCERAWGRRGL